MKAFGKGGQPWSSQEIQIATLNGEQSILELCKLLPISCSEGANLTGRVVDIYLVEAERK